nr:MAG TPA: hypothetical protein [Caudoviricetes sp.]
MLYCSCFCERKQVYNIYKNINHNSCILHIEYARKIVYYIDIERR